MSKAGNNTIFSPVDDRFDFDRKGVFRCRFKREKLLVILYAAGIALIIILIFSVNAPEGSFAQTVFSILEVAVLVASPFLLIGGERYILSGAYYQFTANNEKMLIVCPRDNYRADIYYNKVMSVTYAETKFFGKPHGYYVEVRCTDMVYTYDFIFPQSRNSKNFGIEYTPFRILEEKAGLIDRPEYFAGKRIDNF